MKLQFKHQNFQEEAARAVVDVFSGQGYLTSDYLIDPGNAPQGSLLTLKGWRNEPLTLYMTGERLKDNIHAVQKRNGLPLSDKLEGPGVNLTIEMETGTGKTYTYIKTMYELNRAYGWSKFIVVVPSVAIREGVAKSFAVMEEHFAEQYGKKIRYFIYDSDKLERLEIFASDHAIQVMIINSQAFNAKGEAARRITTKQESFKWRVPIEILAETNPILIIDEPQSVEGPQTKEGLKKFNPLFTLRYSATHKEDYNMVYRLDALDAYNQKLVKKIAVKGIRASGENGTGSFVYLQKINLSTSAPTASIEHDAKTKSGLKKKVSVLKEGDNLYHFSGELDEYKTGFTITRINGVDNSVEFVGGLKLFCGDAVGEVGEEVRSEIQIRETIQSHLEREEELFDKGIKVLSLFFIDEVAKYRQYDATGQALGGVYAKNFEKIYAEEVEKKKDNTPYGRYLAAISASSTHAGYFSVDKGRMVDSKIKNKNERTSDDANAYDLIMKNKELLLDRDPVRSPVRFIFSHSALREGWDNPNVFQICTLKKSGSDVRRRQEVGRGMRLCVNQYGERMDENVLGGDVHTVNKLTVIASESYEDFARGLQSEMAEAIKGRPIAVTPELFEGRTITSSSGEKWKVDEKTARVIYKQLAFNDYLDDDDKLTDVFYEHKSSGEFILGKGLEEYSASICQLLDTVYNGKALKPENARDTNVEAKLSKEKLESEEFKELWSLISPQTVYKVDFDTEKLVETAAAYLNEKLNVSRIYFEVKHGEMEEIKSKEVLQEGSAFSAGKVLGDRKELKTVPCRVKYDLVGKLVEATGLTRKAVVDILTRLIPDKFKLFKANPEEFIRKASDLINEKIADAIVENIVYTKLDINYDAATVFTEKLTTKGILGKNAMKTERNLYDHLIYDSDIEKQMGEALEQRPDMVVVYAKLPEKFRIATPVTVNGYNPDWAIAFKKGTVKHIYVVAETKGSTKDADLRGVEKAKITCAKKHFKAISGTDTVFHHVTSFDELYTAITN